MNVIKLIEIAASLSPLGEAVKRLVDPSVANERTDLQHVISTARGIAQSSSDVGAIMAVAEPAMRAVASLAKHARETQHITEDEYLKIMYSAKLYDTVSNIMMAHIHAASSDDGIDAVDPVSQERQAFQYAAHEQIARLLDDEANGSVIHPPRG